MKDLLRLWFGFSRPVLRRAYALTGFGLLALKYSVDTAVVRYTTGMWLAPWDYLSPLLVERWGALDLNETAWVWFLVLWALPFAWIGVSMSLRRAACAGVSPWWGMLFFVPGLNYVLMLALAIAPDRKPEAWVRPVVGADGTRDDAEARVRVVAALQGIGWGVLITVAVTAIFFFVGSIYGYAVFLGAPVLIGAASASAYNRARERALSESVAVAIVAVTLAMGFALIFGLEGAICLAMAAPIAYPGAILGAVLGRSVALAGHASTPALWLLAAAIPLLGWAEGRVGQRVAPQVFAVTTSIRIDAAPEAVWQSVIAFPRLDEPAWWPFRLGIAYPVGATIDGSGPGAVRRCEFSTGAFVEPVTVWEPGRLLAFDVVENPDAMRELSPYAELATAHLDSGFRAVRGEFRMESAGQGRTLLAGTTWYELGIAPTLYWRLWSDWIVHRIHERVLEHVAETAKRQA